MTKDQRWRKKKGLDGLTNAQRKPKRTPEFRRKKLLLSEYGLTPERFESMLAEQGHRCAICRKANKKWCVDHDHKTGTVRAILCRNCNFAIGHLQDSACLALSAADYLSKHGNL